MSTKLKVGIFFGGPSREREISFKGGKTAYEHLDKSLYEPLLIFVDSIGNFIEIKPELIYAEAIKDFYPSKNLNKGYRLYIEALGELNETQLYKLIYKIGKQIKIEKLSERIDIAFPVMHGPYAEDGNIQGLFEWFGIPYVGPSILGSAIGINKAFQNALLAKSNGQQKKTRIISRKEWDAADKSALFSELTKTIGFPLVVKAPHQGSSIGVGIVKKRSMEEFSKRMNQCFFDTIIAQKDWTKLTTRQKKNILERMLNLDEGIGFPVILNNQQINHPSDLLKALNVYLKVNETAVLSSNNAEDFVLIEEFITGQEFSMGIIQDEDFNIFTLPPTEIYGDIESFDFKSKYQSNVTKKRIPIDTHFDNLKKIEEQGKKAFADLGQNVVCRIDGFLTADDNVIFHDPNTLPGMSPSSLIFKQMAEIGLNITHAINYLIRQSLVQRISEGKRTFKFRELLKRIDQNMVNAKDFQKKKAAIVFGENEEEYVFAQQKYNELSASENYSPTCICAAKNGHYYLIPMPLMFKANIEEFGQAIGSPKHAFVKSLIDKTTAIRKLYAGDVNFDVKKINESDLQTSFDQLFTASSEIEA
ncbi:D-alanine--D-alanine ligase family protein [Arcticibacterium luteifluviistationis]|uniref:D-alanine--D-alanine ligase n=1 Tax=Arcticibacterium luteifluviistationis TaxID=1784714 RepID=A0A2Z4GGP4_9BACT|nr:D-alanine--D-alanine ligase [Arcticibacterium luteifluviistationis]AWW00248.1 D-alanine--D-alanine ligase [Arcticibacterium luteifluviistationis]